MLRAAEGGEPQAVTRHGEEVAVVIDIAEYRRLRGQATSLLDYLSADPILDDDLPVERSPERPREIDLTA